MNKITQTKESASFNKKKTAIKKKRQYKHILDSDIEENLNEKITKRLHSVQIIYFCR